MFQHPHRIVTIAWENNDCRELGMSKITSGMKRRILQLAMPNPWTTVTHPYAVYIHTNWMEGAQSAVSSGISAFDPFGSDRRSTEDDFLQGSKIKMWVPEVSDFLGSTFERLPEMIRTTFCLLQVVISPKCDLFVRKFHKISHFSTAAGENQ